MRKLLAVAVVALAFFACVARAGTVYNKTVYAGGSYGLDPGTPSSGSTENPTGWDTSSWQANGSAYGKMFLMPSEVFGRDVTVGELASISYWTNKLTLHTAVAGDWFFQMYTNPYTGGASWYGDRYNAEPYLAANISETAGAWNQWQTGTVANQLRFEVTRAAGLKLLSELAGGSPWKDQTIGVLGVATATGWANGFTGLVDGLEITLTNGDVGRINFEVVPLPSAAWAGLGLLGAMGVARIIRRRPVQA